MTGEMVDRSCLAGLQAGVGPAATAGMIDRFLDMLPGRVARLRQAVAAGEPPELRDATLSLCCSATMLGAHGLAAASARCQEADRAGAGAAMTELELLATATGAALAAARPALSGD